MSNNRRNVMRITFIALVLGLGFGGLRFGAQRLTGHAVGGNLEGCGGAGGGAPAGPVGSSSNALTIAGVNINLTDSAGTLGKWNSCVLEVQNRGSVAAYPVCLQQWGSYPLACYDDGNSNYCYGLYSDSNSNAPNCTMTFFPGQKCGDIGNLTATVSGTTYHTCQYGTFHTYYQHGSNSSWASSYLCAEQPSAANVSLKLNGLNLTGSYTFVQSDNAPENGTTYSWTLTPPGGTAQVISTTTSATITSADIGGTIQFCVTPAIYTTDGTTSKTQLDGTIYGTQVCTPVVALQYPSASDLSISYNSDGTATAKYTFTDPAAQPESGSQFAWSVEFKDSNGNKYIGGVQETGQTLSASQVSYYAQNHDYAYKYCVTPSTAYVTGTKTCMSSWQKVGAPQASNVAYTLLYEQAVNSPTATAITTGAYSWSDTLPQEQNKGDYGSTLQWYDCGDDVGNGATAIAGATSATYNPQQSDDGYYLEFCVTPGNWAGAKGTQVCSTPQYMGPQAINVAVSLSGTTLTGSYGFYDQTANATQGATTYQWYVYQPSDPTNPYPITGATSKQYTISLAFDGDTLAFCVTPVDSFGVTGPKGCATYALGPAGTNVNISGSVQTGATVTGTYTYTSAFNYAQTGATYQWYTATDSSGTGATAIGGATSNTFTIPISDNHQWLAFCVTASDSTTTGLQTCSSYQQVSPACGGLASGETLYSGQTVVSCGGGTYQLAMQGDGNLVEYESGKALWASNTQGNAGATVSMQGDGNLVIYLNGKAIWASNTSGHSGATLAVQGSDGNVVIYQNGKAIWATNT